jgi:hypothetical protein
VWPGPTASCPASSRQYAYENVNSGLCLSDPNSEGSWEGGPVQLIQYTCGAYPANRRWMYCNSGSHPATMVNDATNEYMCRMADTDVVTTFNFASVNSYYYKNGQCVWR